MLLLLLLSHLVYYIAVIDSVHVYLASGMPRDCIDSVHVYLASGMPRDCIDSPFWDLGVSGRAVFDQMLES